MPKTTINDLVCVSNVLMRVVFCPDSLYQACPAKCKSALASYKIHSLKVISDIPMKNKHIFAFERHVSSSIRKGKRIS